MGSLYRSEEMSLCQLFLQTDSAFASVAELGELGLCQFRDLNPEVSSYMRKYVLEVKRCDEMERKIRFVEQELETHKIVTPEPLGPISIPLPRNMNDLEAKFNKLEDELRLINNSTESLRNNYMQLMDMKHVLLKIRVLFDEGQKTQALHQIAEMQQGYAGPLSPRGAITTNGFTQLHLTQSINSDLDTRVLEKSGNPIELQFMAGIIQRERVQAFERVLWRMCHGKVYLRTIDVDEEEHAPFIDEFKKSAFILFFSGDQLKSRVCKICQGFRANVVDNCTENAVARSELLRSVVLRLEDMNTVVGKTQEHHQRVLNAAALNIRKWDIQVLKLKSIFHTLNMFNLDITQKCLIAECWVPTDDIIRVRAALQHASEMTGSNVPSIVSKLETDASPPTYHKLNKFTKAFQGIVNSYGIANYREINPAPWTIISFPFIFAIMFGDAGHGLIMLLTAVALIAFEKKIETAKIKNEIFNTFYGGRYVILLMGCFAVYTGFIYNDFFSKSLNLFGSEWRNPYSMETLMAILKQEGIKSSDISLELPPLYAFRHKNGPYPFGVDPVWNLALNRLNFLNPMKMKLSIIIGISQMFFGLVLSLFNYMHAGSYVDIFFVFIPQILFLSLIFAYLCLQVILKWVFFWVQPSFIFGQYYPGSHCAPSLLVGLINMFMFKAREQGMAHQNDKKVWEENNQCFLQLWYPNQDKVEAAFILIAAACIPVMLLVKPLIMQSKARNGQHVSTGHGGNGGEFNFGDVIVHQAIHTIEFALGCISHTASYLRLWALSLAHAQLSDVLWTMVLNQGLTQPGVLGMVANFVVFLFFGILSVAVLVLMEGLSAFLHALRLHWVEFQSKFYGGTGILFEPFSFHQIIRIHEELEE